MEEIWKDVVGYEGKYEVSSSGNVRSVKSGLLRKLQPNKKDGYLYVCLCNGKNNQWKGKVHRIVLLSFIGKDINPDRKFVDHINGDKHDNRLSNLRWVTFTENIRAAWDLGIYNNKGEGHAMSKLRDSDILSIRSLIHDGVKNKDIAKMYCIGNSAICDIKKGRTWAHIK